jgi:hypothetical protein
MTAISIGGRPSRTRSDSASAAPSSGARRGATFKCAVQVGSKQILYLYRASKDVESEKAESGEAFAVWLATALPAGSSGTLSSTRQVDVAFRIEYGLA